MNSIHKYPILSKVKVIEKENLYWINEESEEIKTAIKNGQPFYVVGHPKDCDGTPLYHLSLVPYKISGETPIDYIRHFLFNGVSIGMFELDMIYRLTNTIFITNLSDEAFVEIK